MIAIHFVRYKQLFITQIQILKKSTYFIIMNFNDRVKNQLPTTWNVLIFVLQNLKI